MNKKTDKRDMWLKKVNKKKNNFNQKIKLKGNAHNI